MVNNRWEENGGVLCWGVDMEDKSIKGENAIVTATITRTAKQRNGRNAFERNRFGIVMGIT